MGLNVPLLTFSVDLELEIEQQGCERERRFEAITTSLVDLFESFAIPATWAVADPAISAARSAIAVSRAKHEFAILGERTWMGVGAEPARCDRELSRRVTSARRAGIDVCTLALRHDTPCISADCLKKAGISIVRTGVPGIKSGQAFSAIVANSTEIYAAQAAVRFPRPPGESFWRSWRYESWQARRIIRQRCAQNAHCHVVIDGAQLLENGESYLFGLEKMLHTAARQSTRGHWKILTLSQLSPRAKETRRQPALHSLLRPAA